MIAGMVPPVSRQAGDLHLALRAATRDLHDAVEALFAPLDLARRDDYARFLAAQAAAILPLEAALEQAGIDRLLPDWPARARAAALRADLRALDAAVPAMPTLVPAPGAQVLGAAYVLEGSRLGGAVILRRLGTGLPDAFLRHGQGQALWRSFLGRLEALPAHMGEEAIRGARQAFGLFLETGVPA